jgi:hypothetical protein
MRIALIFAIAATACAQIGTVQNAALIPPSSFTLTFVSGSFSGFLGAPFNPPNIISPRMLAVLSYPVSGGQLPNRFLLPVSATLSIRPSGSNALIPVGIIADAVEGSIRFVVPAGVPFGGAELLYKIDSQPTQWTNVTVVPSSFELFSTGAGTGLATPARPGQTIRLTGSGLGYGATVTATIGAVPATVIYAGPDGSQPAGHDTIVLKVPQGAPDGCYVPLTITYNQTTVTSSISKTADGSPCNHPFQLSLADMKTLDSGGAISTGVTSISTQLNAITAAAASRNESASTAISQMNAADLAAFFAPPAAGCSAVVPTAGFAFLGFVPPGPDIGTVTLQNAAATLTLPFNPPAVDNPPAPVLASAKWNWHSSGGKDLPPSSFDFTLPAPIQLNGGAPLVLRRDQDQTVTWNGAAFDSTATVTISLTGLVCTAPAKAGTVAIPAALLSQHRANSIDTLTASITEPAASLSHAQFKLQNGATLLMLVSYSAADSRPVDFQ